MADIYTLSAFQYESLLKMANTEHALIMCLDPSDEDDESSKNRLTKQQEEGHDLEVLGLVEDVSGKMLEQIMAHKLKMGRGYKVFLITETGFTMFNGPKKRSIQ